jgi:hypothetical protein
MIDMIIRLTVGAVLVLAVLNMVQAVALLAKVAGAVARRKPQWGLNLWLPAFTSVDDIRRWLEAWREAVRPSDPAMAEIRTMVRTVGSRHLYLALLSHAWGLALTAVAPNLA